MTNDTPTFNSGSQSLPRTDSSVIQPQYNLTALLQVMQLQFMLELFSRHNNAVLLIDRNFYF
jgi:hypothetical protein